MTICIPAESCGISEDYTSSHYEIAFVMTEEVECIPSSEDVSPEQNEEG